MDKEPEQVLAVPRQALERVGDFQGLSLDPEPYMREFLDKGVAVFLDRESAEKDFSYKQIIPFAVFAHNGKILCYRRGSATGESRLASRHSVGIGGHINPIDVGEKGFDRDSYFTSLYREILEEISIEGPFLQQADTIGVLNDDRSEVGKAHIGFVHLFRLQTDKVQSNEDGICDVQFLTPAEINSLNNIEGWSQIVVDACPGFL